MAFPKTVNFIFGLGQLASTILARLGNPFQEVPNDQIPMPQHRTSAWRPTIVNSHTRVSCLRPMHQFHQGASHQERWRLDQTHSYVTGFNDLSWEWPTCCPGIACDLDEEHHMNVCIVMSVFPHDTPRHCVLFRREAPREHKLKPKMAFPKISIYYSIWDNLAARFWLA